MSGQKKHHIGTANREEKTVWINCDEKGSILQSYNNKSEDGSPGRATVHCVWCGSDVEFDLWPEAESDC